MTQPWRALTLVVLTVAALPALADGGKSYTIDVVPDLETSRGVFDRFTAVDLNNRGVVVGDARGSVIELEDQNALFFYRNGRVTELDTAGFRVRPLALNNKGIVVGRTRVLDDIPRLLRVSRGRKALLLDAGLSDAELRQLRFWGLGPNGEVLASVGPLGEMRAHIYRSRQSRWEPIDTGAAEFDAAQTFAEAINRRGDLLIVTAHENFDSETVFILLADGSIQTVATPSGGVFHVHQLSDSRIVVGSSSHDELTSRAFYWDPVGGGRTIHPEGYLDSFASSINRDGTTLVAATRDPDFDLYLYFYYHPAEGLTQLWTREEFRRLARRAGCRKPKRASTGGVFMNQEREILAGLECTGGSGSFHFSRETGFTLMRDVFVDAGFKSRVAFGYGINDRGQILVRYYDDARDRFVVALLTPAD